MKKLLILIVAVSLLAGCGAPPPPEKEPSEVVKEGFLNLFDITVCTYDIAYVGDITPPAGMGDSVSFDLDFTGGVDFTNTNTPKFTLTIDGDISIADGDPQAVNAEMRLDEENMYAVLHKLDDFDGQIPSEMVEPYLDKWWKIPVPAGSFAQMFEMFNAEEMKSIFEDYSFITDIEYVGAEKGSYHYKGAFNKDAMLQLMVNMNESQGVQFTEEDIAIMKAGMETFDMDAEVWINADSATLNRMRMVMSMDQQGGSSNFDIDMSIDDFNKELKVEAPKDAQELDPTMMMGLMMMFGGGIQNYDDTMYDDDVMYDDAGEMDFDE